MITVLLLVLGLCAGSFINALVWRIHEQSKPAKKRVASARELSIAKGRSMCPHCQHTLAWYDLVPVVSWLALKGKCRYCHKAIGWQYPLVELLTAGLFAGSYALWPLAMHTAADKLAFGVWLAIIVTCVALLVYDVRWMLLPNRLVYPLAGLVAAELVVRLVATHTRLDLFMGAVWGLIVLGGLFYGLFQFSKGKWIGGGDVRLGAVLGALVGGPAAAFLLLFLASVMGTVASAPFLATKRLKMNRQIPFGPFLILAAILVQLAGQSIILWYKRQFLYL